MARSLPPRQDPGAVEFRVKRFVNDESLPPIPICLQGHSGPCPLLALANTLLLRRTISIPENVFSISQEHLLGIIIDTPQAAQADILDVLPKLASAVAVDVCFSGTTAFVPSPELNIFKQFQVRVLHGWIPDPSDELLSACIAHLSYNQVCDELVIAASSPSSQDTPQEQPHEQRLSSSTQPTGLQQTIPSVASPVFSSHGSQTHPDYGPSDPAVNHCTLHAPQYTTPFAPSESGGGNSLETNHHTSPYSDARPVSCPLHRPHVPHTPHVANSAIVSAGQSNSTCTCPSGEYPQHVPDSNFSRQVHADPLGMIQQADGACHTPNMNRQPHAPSAPMLPPGYDSDYEESPYRHVGILDDIVPPLPVSNDIDSLRSQGPSQPAKNVGGAASLTSLNTVSAHGALHGTTVEIQTYTTGSRMRNPHSNCNDHLDLSAAFAANVTLPQNPIPENTPSLKSTLGCVSTVAENAWIVHGFLQENPAMLTLFGLIALHETVLEGEFAVLFFNNHFSVVTKKYGHLYMLVTDAGYIGQPGVIWERLSDIDGNTAFYDAKFCPATVKVASTGSGHSSSSGKAGVPSSSQPMERRPSLTQSRPTSQAQAPSVSPQRRQMANLGSTKRPSYRKEKASKGCIIQ